MKQKLYLILPFIFFLGSAVFSVVTFARLSSVGNDLHTLAQKREQIQKQNAALRSQLATVQSLSRAAQAAELAGYVKIGNLTQVIDGSTQVALHLSTGQSE